ncbi:GDSL-type esterase/lipase family protein [Asanoa hainanensis]|nr:GDSL-type esterase/lipase family protein [Asanoa hainanensis]
MIWTAAFRTGVMDPHEELHFGEPRGFADQTVRQVLHLAGGGEAFRVRLTNRFGRTPLTVGAATAADAKLTFGGAGQVVVPPGEEVASDPVEVPVTAGGDLRVDLYFPERTDLVTYSHRPAELARIIDNDGRIEAVEGRYVVSGVDVPAPADTMIAAAFGDSWFEGVGTTRGANHRSVDFLNRRLASGWVVNLGIAGNRLLRDGVGDHALARFDREVLPIPALTHVLVNLGINDLVLPGMLGEPPASADDLVAGFTALADKAHRAGLRIVVATIGPFGAAVDVRRQVNDWIRTAGVFDGVADVAHAVADPRRPDHIRRDFDSGDGMHLNDLGAQAMADSFDLRDLTL